MHKKIIILFVLLAAYNCMSAQPHYVSVGLRIGGGTYLASGEQIDNSLAPHFMVDAGYTYFWPVNNVELGIHTGLSLGYTGGRYRMPIEEHYRNIDEQGEHPIDYTILSPIAKENVHGFAMEIPAMLAFRWNGLVLNAGLKLQVPMWYQYRQQLKPVTVQAYFSEYDVTVVDKLITGKAAETDYTKGRRDIGDVSLLLGLEIGYEWQLTPSDVLGLTGYFDGAPYSHPAGKHTEHVVDIAPIASVSNPEYPVPAVEINTIVGTYATRLNYLDFGLKVYYRFDVLHSLNK